MIEILIGGCLRALYILPLLLAFVIVARHGRYLPLWLPQIGTVAAYTAYVLAERWQWRPQYSVSFAILAVIMLTIVTHKFLFAPFVERGQPYASLIRSVGAIVIVQAFLGLVTGGYALSFSLMMPEWQVFVGPPVNDTLRSPDLIALAMAAMAPMLLGYVITRTRFGLSYRAVAASRDLAHEYGLPVIKVDSGVMVLAGTLSGVAGIIYGLRYGLRSDMLISPTLDVVAVAVAAGSERLWSGCLLLFGVGMLQSLCQAVPAISTFEYAVAYVVLAAGLVLHHVLLPRWRATGWERRVRSRAAGTAA